MATRETYRGDEKIEIVNLFEEVDDNHWQSRPQEFER